MNVIGAASQMNHGVGVLVDPNDFKKFIRFGGKGTCVLAYAVHENLNRAGRRVVASVKSINGAEAVLLRCFRQPDWHVL